MIQLKIKNIASGEYSHGAQFETMELAQEWLAKQLAKSPCPFGKPEHQRDVLNELGEVIGTENVPSEFEVETLDITSALEQSRINAEAKAYLASTDFYVIRLAEEGIPYSAEIKALRQAARASIV